MDMRKLRWIYCLSAVVALCWTGCTKENIDIDENLTVDERINKFIVDGVQTYYLWEAETDWKQYDNNATFAAYTDHNQLFNRLIYKDDHWSMLTEDIQGLENEFSGVSTTFGYTLTFYYNPFTSNNEVIAIILFVSPHSPAATAGLKRGDILIRMNGSVITTDNYLNLYYSSSLTIQCGIPNMEDRNLTLLPEIYSMTAVEMYENPINIHKIIEKNGSKIGYLCYTSYQIESEKELEQLFSAFKAAGVREVVLDLRYNTGGYSRTAQILSSILAPSSVVKNKEIYLKHFYNAMYTAYLEKNKYPLSETFVDTLSVNMDLQRLYVLTSNRTASASEATIVGLAPYLNVVQIGDTTTGKYCGGVLLSPEDIYDDNEKAIKYYREFKNWGMYIMIYRYANIRGVTSFSSGLVPDIQFTEDPFDLKPLGDEDDPLLGRALADILGEPYLAPRSAKTPLPLNKLPDLKKPSFLINYELRITNYESIHTMK